MTRRPRLALLCGILALTAASAQAQVKPDACAKQEQDYENTRKRRQLNANIPGPRLTSSPELNELVREYWQAQDEVLGASRVGSIYGGFYGSYGKDGHWFAGPILAFRLSLVSSSSTAYAETRALQKKERILNYGLPDVEQVLQDQLIEVESSVDRISEQLTQIDKKDPVVDETPADSIAARTRLQYEVGLRRSLALQLRSRCRARFDLREAQTEARTWGIALKREVEMSSPSTFATTLATVLVPTSLQFGVGYGFRVGARRADEPQTVTTGHIGVMTSAGKGSLGVGLVLGQDGYAGLYVALGTDLFGASPR